MGLPSTYLELVNWAALVVVPTNKELGSEIFDYVGLAQAEIEEGGSESHEVEMAVDSIRDLITDPERGGTPKEWDKVLEGCHG